MWVTLFVCVKSGLSHGAMDWPMFVVCSDHAHLCLELNENILPCNTKTGNVMKSSKGV